MAKWVNKFFCFLFCLLFVLAIVVFARTHLSKGTLEEFSANDAEVRVSEFLRLLSAGSPEALDYVWYDGSEKKMTKCLEDYESTDLDVIVQDEQQAYNGMKHLFSSEAGIELISSLFSEARVINSSFNDLAVTGKTFYSNDSVLNYVDYGHCMKYFLLDYTIDSGAIVLNDISDFNDCINTLDGIPTSQTKCFRFVYQSGKLQIDLYYFLEQLGLLDMIYYGDSLDTFAGLGGVQTGINYGSTFVDSIETESEECLFTLVNYATSKDVNGLYDYLLGIALDHNNTIGNDVGTALAYFSEFTDEERAVFFDRLEEFDVPYILVYRDANNYLSCICLYCFDGQYQTKELLLQLDDEFSDVTKLCISSGCLFQHVFKAMQSMGYQINYTGSVNSVYDVDLETTEDSE